MKIAVRIVCCLSLSFIIISCGGNAPENAQQENPDDKTIVSSDDFLCECLTSPGNSEFMKQNENACRDTISKAIGVANWERINMRDHPEISNRFDELASRCSGIQTGKEQVQGNSGENSNDAVKWEGAITSDAGYVWETIDNSADIYTVLSFNGQEFRNVAYVMNGSSNPKDFTRVVELSGTWIAVGENKASGILSDSHQQVEWTFNEDFTRLVNNKGVTYRKVKVE